MIWYSSWRYSNESDPYTRLSRNSHASLKCFEFVDKIYRSRRENCISRCLAPNHSQCPLFKCTFIWPRRCMAKMLSESRLFYSIEKSLNQSLKLIQACSPQEGSPSTWVSLCPSLVRSWYACTIQGHSCAFSSLALFSSAASWWRTSDSSSLCSRYRTCHQISHIWCWCHTAVCSEYRSGAD